MADHNISINFTGNNSGSNPYSNSSADILKSILDRLNNTLDKLNTTINASSKSDGGIATSNTSKSPGSNDRNNDKEFVNKIDRLYNSAIAAVGYTAAKLSSTFATAAMSFATSQANIAGGYIFGNNLEAGVSGIGSLYNASRNTKNSLISQIGGGVASVAATLATKNPIAGLMAYSLGSTATDNFLNAKDQSAEMIKQYKTQNALIASEGEWGIGFNRYYKRNANYNADVGGVRINLPLSKEFEDRYGGSPNYNNIISGVVPYANPNAMSHDLNNVVQNFKKAGFTIEEFGKLTTQAAQAQALNGKNITEFSKDLINSRAKFGFGYDANTNQLALGLQGMGFDENKSKYLAYQSQFNPGILNGINSFLGADPSSFYSNKVIGDRLGIDINKILMGGDWGKNTTSGFRKQISKELDSFRNNGEYGGDLAVLNAIGYNPGSVLGWKRSRVQSNNNPEGIGDVSLAPSQDLTKQQLQVDTISVATLKVDNFIAGTPLISSNKSNNSNNRTKK